MEGKIVFTDLRKCYCLLLVSNVFYKLDLVVVSNYLLSFFELCSCRPYVWGHFCLSYNGQKLVIDTDCIRDYGVKDGDQVCDKFLYLRYLLHNDSYGRLCFYSCWEGDLIGYIRLFIVCAT